MHSVITQAVAITHAAILLGSCNTLCDLPCVTFSAGFVVRAKCPRTEDAGELRDGTIDSWLVQSDPAASVQPLCLRW